jgi:ribonuclease-3
LRHTSLPKFIAVGEKIKGTGNTGGTALPYNIIEDVFEAFLGAVYIDSGFEVAKTWLISLWESTVDFSELASKQDGLKAKLNRHCMQYLGFVPTIEDLGGGAASGWSTRISLPDGTVIATGTSKDRKSSEEMAIKKALEYYGVTFSLSPPLADASRREATRAPLWGAGKAKA